MKTEPETHGPFAWLGVWLFRDLRDDWRGLIGLAAFVCACVIGMVFAAEGIQLWTLILLGIAIVLFLVNGRHARRRPRD